MAMVREYLEKLEQHTKIYGEKTVVLWECGKFYEVYGLKQRETDEIVTPAILAFSRVGDTRITRKNVVIDGYDVVMSGVPTPQLDKYLNKLNTHGYTVPVYTQDLPASPTPRSLAYIASPGTLLSGAQDQITNNIMCVWLERYTLTQRSAPYFLCGLANIDIFTGESNLYEFRQDDTHHSTSFDELSKFYSIYQPSELIFIYSGYEDKEIDDILRFCCIHVPAIHKISLQSEETPFYTEALNCEKQTYQETLLKQFYQIVDYDYFIDSLHLGYHPLATQTFCFLLEFVKQHNPDLIRHIPEPYIDNINNNLLLANHSLQQLNILGNGQYRGQYSSVCSLLNKCKTSMGKRFFKKMLLHPTCDADYLNKEYAITDYCLQHFERLQHLRQDFSRIRDLEKLYRRIILKMITPCEITCLKENITLILSIYREIRGDEVLMEYLNNYIAEDLEESGNALINFFNETFDLSIAETINTLPLAENCFKRGYSEEVDQSDQQYSESKDKIGAIRGYLNNVLAKAEKRKSKTSYVTINITEKNIYSTICTQRRAGLLKSKLKKGETTLDYDSSFNGEKRDIVFSHNHGDVTFNTASKKNYKRIDSIQMTSIASNITRGYHKLKDNLKNEYADVLLKLQDYGEHLKKVVQFITRLDTVLTKAYIAKTYNYCRPEIDTQREKGYLEATQIRHCLIEQLQSDEVYVPNDVSLGGTIDGILLFGTNAVGKSSLMRSIGIAVILAQSGLFVPCKQFVYKPYKSLFTRILGNDNIFKGLSTFAVEICELRTILNLADENSLILGDELCSGTETTSALKIFGAGLISLHERKSSFIFTTHFHEIRSMDTITSLERMVMRHMSVRYDIEKDELTYARTLKEGAGEHVYGLEVCKYFKLPTDFMNLANSLSIPNELVSLLSRTPSHYNAQKIKGGLCEKCGQREAVDIHHLVYQKNADKNGFINHIHKNHKANLMNLCKICHQEIHQEGTQHRRVKTTTGMQLMATT